MRGVRGGAGKMHTTTVRFDADVWALIVAHCERLGIAYGEFIRGAVLLRLGSLLLDTDRAEELDQQVAALARRLGRVSRLVERIAVFVGFTAPRSAVTQTEPPRSVARPGRDTRSHERGRLANALSRRASSPDQRSSGVRRHNDISHLAESEELP